MAQKVEGKGEHMMGVGVGGRERESREVWDGGRESYRDSGTKMSGLYTESLGEGKPQP